MKPQVSARSFSLRKRVAWLFVFSMFVLLLLNAIWSYKGAVDASNRAFDRSLLSALNSIAESIHATEGRVRVDIPYSALDMSEDGIQERVYYSVFDASGRMITGYEDLPIPSHAGKLEGPVITDALYQGRPIRVSAVYKRLYDPDLQEGDEITVVLAETTETRNRLALSLFIDGLTPQILLIIGGLVIVFLVLRNAFAPLLALRDSIRQRTVENLEPISHDNVPQELLPLVEAINAHMSRLERLLAARRRFLADAAHQIRTPLTVLGTQAEYGLRQNDPVEIERAFNGLIETIRGARRMVNQMLILARAEPANGMIQDFEVLDFGALVCDVAGELATLAIARQIDLSFEAPPAPVFISGNATMLREMVSNLIDNALRYAAIAGQVGVQVRSNGDEVQLKVRDDGPGIPESEREKVFQRFYRILGNVSAEGSGLGLAIVREICWAHQGRIQLESGTGGMGLCVEVCIPIYQNSSGANRPSVKN